MSIQLYLFSNLTDNTPRQATLDEVVSRIRGQELQAFTAEYRNLLSCYREAQQEGREEAEVYKRQAAAFKQQSPCFLAWVELEGGRTASHIRA